MDAGFAGGGFKPRHFGAARPAPLLLLLLAAELEAGVSSTSVWPMPRKRNNEAQIMQCTPTPLVGLVFGNPLQTRRFVSVSRSQQACFGEKETKTICWRTYVPQ